MGLNRNRGNEFERWLAKQVGVTRTGHFGVGDVVTKRTVYECKERQVLPKFLKDAVAQAERHRTDKDQMAVAAFHQHGRPHGEDLVVMRLDEFLLWHGEDQA